MLKISTTLRTNTGTHTKVMEVKKLRGIKLNKKFFGLRKIIPTEFGKENSVTYYYITSSEIELTAAFICSILWYQGSSKLRMLIYKT